MIDNLSPLSTLPGGEPHAATLARGRVNGRRPDCVLHHP
ncbi:hypothetical protein FDG2_3123 [Candidatus Protofrankia californiensis]|uniref:Uncharacterized protein n=1 Tax=Candidatus Protofrankia californiensis TaxID=1839754 RepID=A0A1C3NZ06_9ACTN|nr:hypothetical protein FDG2_3123 [Candidatus Protofrankia californiensis]